MKDIDFDELDKAVSSLMGSVPKDDPAKDTDADGVINSSDHNIAAPEEDEELSTSAVDDTEDAPVVVDTEPDIAPKPEADLIEESEEKLDQLPTVTPRGISPPSRGRFMDMVRPSREMGRPSSLMSRQGTTLQPSSMQVGNEAASKEAEKRPLEESNAALAAMVHELEDTTDTASSFSQSADTPAFPEVATDSIDQAEDAAPLSSPFLPDAKVEKRPLGRPLETTFSTDSVSEETENVDLSGGNIPHQEEEPSVSPNKDAQRPEDPLPAELDSEILSIETEDSTFRQQDAEIPVENKTETVEAPSEAPLPTEATQTTSSFTADTRRTMAAASIPQQYKLDTGTSDDVPAAGAIYDAQPLAHPAKSTPGWVWVLGIIGVLVLGAAGGAAVYFLGLL